MRTRIIVLVVFILAARLCLAQYLSGKTITISFENSSTLEALGQINSLNGIKLAYNPDAIPGQNKITKTFSNQPIDDVLKDILGTGYELKYRGSYVIIQPMRVPEAQKKTFKILGEVKDASTGKQIKNATIYEVNKLSSTLTDEEGSFELSVAAKAEKVTFSISRENYQDTIIQVNNISPLSRSLVLQPTNAIEDKSNVFEIETKKLVQFFTSKVSRLNTRNVKLEEERVFQFSVVPMIGTNGKLSGQVTNNFSFNLLAGYSNGLNGFELGGLYNINRTQTRGLQIGGLGNATGGQTNGVQIAGILNTTKGYTSGFQTAGIFNLVTNEVQGVQLAGFLNIAKQTTGAQIAGFSNVASKKLKGAQVAGFFNASENIKGTQVAGFVNVAKNMGGFQLAGFTNVASETTRVQLAGFANYAKKLLGIQVGIINIADTVESGATIGIINIVKKGKHQLAIEHNDYMDVNASFRMGTNKFYSVISSGINLSQNKFWQFGLGFGTQYKIKNKFFGNVELSSHSVNKMGRGFENQNFLNRLDLNFGYKLAKHFSINAGPVLNVYVTDLYDSSSGAYGDDFGQSPFYNQTTNGTNVSMWIGYAASVRF